MRVGAARARVGGVRARGAARPVRKCGVGNYVWGLCASASAVPLHSPGLNSRFERREGRRRQEGVPDGFAG